jgi:hypothetical protein
MQNTIQQKQQGMTFIGLVLVIAAGVFLAILAMKVTPAYIEFMGVKKAIQRLADDPAFNEMGKKEIIQAFNKSAEVGYITVIRGNDLVIEKGQTGNVVTAQYQVTIPIVANASVLLDFNATTAK